MAKTLYLDPISVDEVDSDNRPLFEGEEGFTREPLMEGEGEGKGPYTLICPECEIPLFVNLQESAIPRGLQCQCTKCGQYSEIPL